MALAVNTDLKIPYEIGRFIAAQVPYLDDIHPMPGNDYSTAPWAEHKGHFKSGPRSAAGQMKQGLLLEVINYTHKPRSIHAKYGEWLVLGGSQGSFRKVFQVLQQTLNLKKVENLSDENVSYWAIQTWDGQTLPEPILAKRNEYISYETMNADYQEFKKSYE